MTIGLLSNPGTLGFLVLLMITIIFLAGSYPGLVLARFKPIAALKGKLSQRHIGGFSLRRILVVTQFAISQMLVIGMIVIAGQIHYSKTTDLGFRKDGIVLLPLPQSDRTKMNTLFTRLSAVTGTDNMTLCSEAPASRSRSLTTFRYDSRPKEESLEINIKYGDATYVPTYGLTLVAGRNVFASDTLRELLINETCLRKLNLHDPNAIIGKRLYFSNSDGGYSATVAGVIKDFHNNSFHAPIDPIVILPKAGAYRFASAKINVADIHAIMPTYEKIWNETYPDYVYSYQFLDERIARFYKQDTIIFRLVEWFAGIAILISCLGLYGLVAFMAVQKTKEIGVRKVLGAGVNNILWLFGREFSRLLLLAFIIAAPIAGWAMHRWLQGFQYRISINWEIFALAIGSTFAIAMLTVAWHSVKAALANPVKSLRSE